MEAGWGLVGAMQGRGLAEEAMRAASVWADHHWPEEQMTCIIHPDNAASLRVAGKLGFGEIARSNDHDSPMVILERPRTTTASGPTLAGSTSAS